MMFPKEKRVKDKKGVREYGYNNSGCEICGSFYYNSVHHITFKSHNGGDEDNNLITLCINHHKQAHGVDAKEMKEICLKIKKDK